MLKLGVNIDHIATLRQARYRGRIGGEPDPVEAARLCEAAGAHGITAHLREDRRHMQDDDLIRLRKTVRTRLNLEMANTPEMVGFALKLRPDIICLVPEKREELTTEGGLDATAQEAALMETCGRMHEAGIETSLFIDPDPGQVESAARIGTDFIELHTGAFAEAGNTPEARREEWGRLNRAAREAATGGLRVNAGHGIHYGNVEDLLSIPHLVELNIGHSIVSRAAFVGLSRAVEEMLEPLRRYPAE